VFAGLTVLLTVLAIAFGELLVLVVAVPFAAVTGVFWYHATGRLAERVARQRARAEARGADPGRGGFGAGPRGARERPGGERRFGPGGRFGRGQRTNARGEARGQQRRAPGADPGPSAAEAHRILGIEQGADQESIRAAYRERVKETHPDTDTGSEEEFKRVRRAYERLTD